MRAYLAISRAPQCTHNNELKIVLRKILTEQVEQSHAEGIAEVGNGKEVYGTTTMHDETTKEVFEIMEKSIISPQVWESITTPGMETTIKMLEKPSILANTLFQTTDTSVFWSTSLPDLLLQKLKNSSRLNGITYFRADMEIELKVNATRFQAGRYILGWLPYGGGSITGAPSSYSQEHWRRAHLANLQAVTSTTHIEIDLATQSSAKMVIPFTSHMNFITVKQGIVPNLGILFLYPYSPLAVGSGDTIAQVAIWGRFTNIHLSGNAVLQSAVSKLENAKSKNGPISEVAAKVVMTTQALSKIPILSPIASTVGWFAALAGDVARVWGYSKPSITAAPSHFYRKGIAHMNHIDGAFNGKKLSALSDAATPINSDRAGTKIDEMSFQFLYSIPVWFSTVTWTQSQTAGTTLTYFDVGPGFYPSTIGKGFTEPPFATISRYFSNWRGSFVFKFKFVKTEFHSGRLAFSFVPNDQFGAAPATSLTVDQTDNLVRHIVDLRETNEVEYCVPFISPFNYLETGAGSSIGRVYVTVINQLVSPSTVPTDVPILIEVSGGDDLDFGFPTQINSGTTIQPYVPAIIQTNVRQLECEELGTGYFTDKAQVESLGERIVTLRSFFKRAMYCAVNFNANTRTYFAPFDIAPVLQNTDNTTALIRSSNSNSIWYGDALEFWSFCYLFSSGSVRIYYCPDVPSAIGGTVTTKLLHYNNETCPTTNDGVVTIPFNLPTDTGIQSIDGVYQYEVPSYTLGGVRNNMSQLVGSTTAISSGNHSAQRGIAPVVVDMYMPASAANVNNGNWYRSVGDDYNLSRFSGVVPFVLNTTT